MCFGQDAGLRTVAPILQGNVLFGVFANNNVLPKLRMHFFPHAITSTPDRLFVASFDLPWSTPPLYGMAAQNAIVLPSSVFSWQSQEQFYAVHVVTCQTRKRFVALDGQRWNGDAGVRSCQFCGTCCSNVDHQNLCDKVPRTAAQRCDYSLRNSSSPAIPL